MPQPTPHHHDRQRLFVIHHGLVDFRSHYYGEGRAWVEACRARAIALRLYVNCNAQPALVRELAARPVFRHAPDAMVEPDPTVRALADFIGLGNDFAHACDALVQDGVTSHDIVVVTFATERCMLGAAQWLERLAPGARPRLALIFHVPGFDWKPDEDGTLVGGDVTHHRYAMKRLAAALPQQRLALYATNRRLARTLSLVLNRPCEAAPLATLLPDDAVLAAEPAERAPHVHVRIAGEFRAEKGSDLAADIVARFSARRPGRSFGIQLGTRLEAEAFAKAVAGLPAPVHLHYGPLGQDEFVLRLARTDIVLLPYLWQRYAMRASGIFSEALGLGRVIVAPAQTVMGEMLASGLGAGVTFREFSAEAVTDALVAASEEFPALSAAAQFGRLAWRKANSAEALLETVLRRFGHA